MAADPTPQDEFYFQWHLTERCNRACLHCYQGCEPYVELPLPKLLEVLQCMEQALHKWGKVGTLSLTGGEPFLRREDLHHLMGRIDESDSFAHYDVLTNGSLVSDSEAAELSGRRKLRRVQVSLEGAAAESNDAVRGEGSFGSTLGAIRRLRERSVAVAAMTTLTHRNRTEVPALVELLAGEGVQTLALERFIPEGRGAALDDQVLTPCELRETYQQVYGIALGRPGIRILLHRPLFALLAPEDPSVGAMCSAGANALTIMPDGTVFPCRRLPIPIGNVLQDGLFKIWYDSELLWRIRDPQNLEGKCRDCDLLPQCRGCRAAAFFASGDCMAEDPQCWR